MTNSVRAGMSSSYKSLDEKTIQIMEKVTRAHEILHSNNRWLQATYFLTYFH